jgi:beta-glucosidase
MKRPSRLTLLSMAVVATAILNWIGLDRPGLAAAEPPAPATTTTTTGAKPPAGARYRDPKAAINDRVADLVGRMTPAEKIAQLVSVNWEHTHLDDAKTHALAPEAAKRLIGNGIGEITRPSDRHDDARSATEFANAVQRFLVKETRLGIPALMHEEALHGFAVPSATSFPQAIGLSATFDPELVEQVFGVAARQARARGVQHVLAPVVDVARDPRWGRIEETFGEDPYLVGRMGVAAIRGFQGRRNADAPIDAAHVAATVKHFTGHGTPEGGRNTGPGNYSMHVLREVFLPPVEAAVREAAVASVMPSYNEVDGIPSHANRWLLTDLLRGEWGFRGFIVSDYFGVSELEKKHHVVADLPSAGRKALEAGVDLEVPEGEGYPTLVDDLKAGRVAMAAVDKAVGYVLRAKFQLGLFEQPYTLAPAPEAERPADRALARHAAEEAIILLRNDGGLLPFDISKIKSIAVIGPNADTVRLGGYSGKPDRVVGVFEGIKTRAAGRVTVTTAPGCGLTKGNRGWKDDLVEMADPMEDARLITEATKVSAKADLTVLVLGQNEQLSREGWADNHRGDRTDLDLAGRQNDLASAVLANKKPVVLVLLHGGPLAIPVLAKVVPAIIDGFYLGEETGTAIAEVLFGDISPAGRLPVSVPRSVGSIPAYYNYKPSARRLYLEEEPGPLWPFGFGLSYTTFKYEKPVLTPASIMPNGKTVASVTVTNTGKVASDEVVQLYLHDVVSSVTRPISELKGFRRVHLKPGESKKVEFPIGFDELAFYDGGMKRVVEPGRFEVMVGGSSADLKKVDLEVAAR